MITDLAGNAYEQKKWEIKEWIRRGILFNECPSYVKLLTPFVGGPWNGKKAIIPDHVNEWKVVNDIGPCVSAIESKESAKPTNTKITRYYKVGNKMISNER